MGKSPRDRSRRKTAALFGVERLETRAMLAMQELLVNGGADAALVNGEIPGWREVRGSSWTRGPAITPHSGTGHFFAGRVASAELAQTVDVSLFAPRIDGGGQRYEFTGVIRSWNQNPPDTGRIILEHRNASGAVVGSFDTGNIWNRDSWSSITRTGWLPAGTRSVTVRLLAERKSGNDNDGYFDSLSLKLERSLPLAPTNLVATAGNAQASLRWTAPSSNGGAAITNYVVQFSSNKGRTWTTFNRAASAATTAVVPGLVSGTPYIFRVAAVNGVGTGLFSSNSKSVRPLAVAAPGGPTNLVATAGNAQVSLRWTAPSSNGGAAITNYVIQFSSNNGNAWTTFNRAASTATTAAVTGLANGTNYVFRVAAVNVAGTSPYSATSSSVRPAAASAAVTRTTSINGSISRASEVDSFSVAVAPGAILRVQVTASGTDLYPLLELTTPGGALLKGASMWDNRSADLGLYELASGVAVIRVRAQAGRTGSYTLNVMVTTRAELTAEVIRLTNIERTRAGLSPLVRSSLLEKAAQAHVQDMDNSNRYLAHIGSNNSTPEMRLRAVGYKMAWVRNGNNLYGIRLENAAAGYWSAAEVVQGWMNSPGHRAAIMDPHTREIGVGFTYDHQTERTYWIQNFGVPWRDGLHRRF